MGYLLDSGRVVGFLQMCGLGYGGKERRGGWVHTGMVEACLIFGSGYWPLIEKDILLGHFGLSWADIGNEVGGGRCYLRFRSTRGVVLSDILIRTLVLRLWMILNPIFFKKNSRLVIFE